MLDGLEVTEVGFKDLETIIDYRIEAEFFDKRFLHTEGLFKKITWKPFFKIADYENGRAYSSDEFGVEEGIRVSKIGDVTNKRLIANWETLSYSEFNNQKGTKLVEDDILMSLTGDPPDVGKVNLISNITEPATFNQRVARVFLVPAQSDFISAKVFFAVIANRHCREQLERFAKGIRQRNLGIECLELLKIPIFNRHFQLLIDSLIIKSFEQNKIQQQKYQQAETLLLEELGLKDWQPSEANTAEASFADSFLSSGRLDAEYYQPKFIEIENKLKNSGFEVRPFSDLIKSLDNGIEERTYVENGGLRYLRVTDLTKTDISDSSPRFVALKKPPQRLLLNENCILISRSGSLGLVNIVTKEISNAVLSSHIFRVELDTSKVTPIFIETYLRSVIGQELLIRQNNGGVVPEINHAGLNKVLVPVPPITRMQEISERLFAIRYQSMQSKKRSSELLDLAKQAVEVAIEQNEEAAEQLIAAQLAKQE